MNKFACILDRVVDGDTFVIHEANLGFHTKTGMRRIRVKDLLCPERDDPGSTTSPSGSEATAVAKELLLAVDAKVFVAPYEDKMSIDRYVCDVFIGDTFFRELMVSRGVGTYVNFYKTLDVWAFTHPVRQMTMHV